MPELKLHHVSIVVGDLDRAIDFYQRVFGLARVPRPAFPSRGAWLVSDGLELHLLSHPGTFRSGGIDTADCHFAMNTDDFQGMVDRLHALGFREDAAEDDPLRLLVIRESLAGFPQLYVLDPDRNIVEVNGAR